MIRLPVIAAALILPGLMLAQPTDDAARCQVAAGSYLTGTVVSGPRFKPGAPLHGTYLSHTHLTLRGDADGRAYNVAIDDAFANGYRHSQRSVPAPLNTAVRIGSEETCPAAPSARCPTGPAVLSGLSTGGEWIRTFGFRARGPWFFEAAGTIGFV
jgi:hypothetical protein